MNDRELLKQAYDALSLINHRGNTDEELQKVGLTLTMIEARLEEPEPEPYFYLWPPSRAILDGPEFPPGVTSDIPLIPLYRHPPRPTEKDVNLYGYTGPVLEQLTEKNK